MAALLSTKLAVCLSTITVLSSAVGCGDDQKSQTPSSTAGSGGSGGSSATGGTGGSTGGTGGSTGGTGGSTGGTGGSTGGTGGSMPDPDSGVIQCGTTVCAPAGMPPLTVPPCCTATNTCGISIANQCIEIPEAGPGTMPEAGPTGVPDPSCGTIDVFGIALSGCCLPDNTCGYSSPAPQFGGCLSFAQLSMFPGIMLPEGGPLSCVYPPPAP